MRRVRRVFRVGAMGGLSIGIISLTTTVKTYPATHPIAYTPESKVLSLSTLQPIYLSKLKKRRASEPKLPVHTVIATTYWIGESATAENGYISNIPSQWDSNTVRSFGGVDTPGKRKFTPKHNTYYYALPAAEYTESGLVAGAHQKSPWKDEITQLSAGRSLFKGRWMRVTNGKKVVYAQWHDVGPNEEKDYAYVFGTSQPKNTFGERAGLDLSPDASDALNLAGSATVSWQFVDAQDVPQGPWKAYPAINNRTYW